LQWKFGTFNLLEEWSLQEFRAWGGDSDKIWAWKTGALHPFNLLCISYALCVVLIRCAAPLPRCTMPRSLSQFLLRFLPFTLKTRLGLFTLSLGTNEVFCMKNTLYPFDFNFYLKETHFSNVCFSLCFSKTLFWQFDLLFDFWWTNASNFLSLLQELECKSLARWPGLHFWTYYI